MKNEKANTRYVPIQYKKRRHFMSGSLGIEPTVCTHIQTTYSRQPTTTQRQQLALYWYFRGAKMARNVVRTNFFDTWEQKKGFTRQFRNKMSDKAISALSLAIFFSLSMHCSSSSNRTQYAQMRMHRWHRVAPCLTCTYRPGTLTQLTPVQLGYWCGRLLEARPDVPHTRFPFGIVLPFVVRIRTDILQILFFHASEPAIFIIFIARLHFILPQVLYPWIRSVDSRFWKSEQRSRTWLVSLNTYISVCIVM